MANLICYHLQAVYSLCIGITASQRTSFVHCWPTKLPMHGILVALALLLGVSARDPTTCPERVLPVPGYTTAWLAPLSYFKCPNASNIPDKAYLTQYSAEYPTRADSWTQNCSDSYIWADGTSQAGDFNSYCCSRYHPWLVEYNHSTADIK